MSTTAWLLLILAATWSGYMWGASGRVGGEGKSRRGRTRFQLYAPGKDAGEADGCDCKWIRPGTLIANEAMQTLTEGWGRIHDHDCPKHGATP